MNYEERIIAWIRANQHNPALISRGVTLTEGDAKDIASNIVNHVDYSPDAPVVRRVWTFRLCIHGVDINMPAPSKLPAPKQEPQAHFVDRRWVGEERAHLVWYDLSNPGALSEGDWVFDPASHAHYAGQVTRLLDWGVELRWHKTPQDSFTAYESWNNLSGMWWADPAMQGD
jgi:hypothetical protein